MQPTKPPVEGGWGAVSPSQDSPRHKRPLTRHPTLAAPYPPQEAAAAVRQKWGECRKLLCAIVALGSGAVGAAFEESSVAVIIARFYWPTRSREGAGSIGQDGPVERNGLGDASP